MHGKSIKSPRYLQAFSSISIDSGFIRMSGAPNVRKTALRPSLWFELLTHPKDDGKMKQMDTPTTFYITGPSYTKI